eukprot:115520-Prorocentrum_minimum.AAC.1
MIPIGHCWSLLVIMLILQVTADARPSRSGASYQPHTPTILTFTPLHPELDVQDKKKEGEKLRSSANCLRGGGGGMSHLRY